MQNINDATINIRAIQHYLYCRHRWGLLTIGDMWEENFFVTRANLLHERVHDSGSKYTMKNRRVFHSVSVYNDLPEYNIYGVLDCLEAEADAGGIRLPGCRGKYLLHIVEYKPTKPARRDFNQDDLMQVFAQKLCVDYIFASDCDAYIYYADTKQRVKLPLRENFSFYDTLMKNTLAAMRRQIAMGTIPALQQGQNCGGCSMKDVCMPKIKLNYDIRKQIKEF